MKSHSTKQYAFKMYFEVVLATLSILSAQGLPTSWQQKAPSNESLAHAKEVLAMYPLTDGHNDLPMVYRARLENDVEGVDLESDVNIQWGYSHTDIPRLRQGQVGAQFWSTFIGCDKQHRDAVRATLEQIDVVKLFVDKYSNDFQFVTTAQGIEDAFAAGKIGSLIGIEGGHQIDSSLATLRMFYELGVRYLTITHTCTTPWADSSTEDDDPGPDIHDGITPWGELLIREMNRLGMFADLSHVSRATMIDVLNVSRAPVIFSHSNAWEVCQNNRNVQDDVLRMTAENGGVVMVTFVKSFLGCAPSDTKPMDFRLAADHIEHIRDVAGIDHVGIGGDFDGMSGGPPGLEDVTGYPILFAELVDRGWSDEDLQKLAGANLVRAFRQMEQVRDEMAAEGIKPINNWIPQEDLNPEHGCRTEN